MRGIVLGLTLSWMLHGIVVASETPIQAGLFRNAVQPILSKAGCNSGACHGAAAGKNGFKLSLRGYDDEGDFRAIAKNAFGRRLDAADPGQSLLLTKASGGTPHKGGVRFETNSTEYKILADWIANGAPEPGAADPRIERIELLPAQSRLKIGAEIQLSVRAYFSNGESQDVTRWAKYSASNQAVTIVDDAGKAKVVGNGEGAITAWYLSRIAIANVAAPNEKMIPDDQFKNLPRANFIDELVLEKLKDLNIPPSSGADDAVFLRRVFIDTIGTLPTADEARAFLADTSSDKRARLIDALLERSEYVDYWSYKWSDLLLVNSEKLKADAMWSYYRWVRENVARNTPWDEFVRGVVTASGGTLENGAACFYVLHGDPSDSTETITQAFMGLAINCAKCHNHPLEKWTNDQYFEMANLLARVRSKNGAGEGNKIVFCSADGDLIQPLTGKARAPRPLDGTAIPIEATADRREHLANWLVSKNNPYFARAVVNRVWANYFNSGLVMNVDDMRVTNPPSNEKLLAAAAQFLIDKKYDLKALMRAILNSSTYQRDSRTLPENASDSRYYARYYPRRIMAEVLLDAMSQVTGSPTKFPKYPDGYRAMQLPDSSVDSYFLKSFGRPNRLITCECERTGEPSMAQALHISNGDTLNQKLEAKENAISKALAAKLPIERIVDDVFLGALSRFPSADEKAKILAVVAKTDPKDLRGAVEDVYWGVLSSKEFLFNR
ncbi:MAG: DUF1549 domain-containing protein [Planctomycetota bacterium]